MGLPDRIDEAGGMRTSGGAFGRRLNRRWAGTRRAGLVSMLVPVLAGVMLAGTGCMLGQTTGGSPDSTAAPGSQSAPAATNLPAGQGKSTTPASEPTNTAVPQETTPEKVIQGKAIRELAAGQRASLWNYQGKTVEKIVFSGVEFNGTETLPTELTQKPGQPLEPDLVRESTRRLFASGLYRDIAVRAEPNGKGVTLTFAGVPRFFVGRVTVKNVKSDRLTSLLEFATKLDPGTPFSPSQIPAGADGIRQTLEQNGYYESKVTSDTMRLRDTKQVDAVYTVTVGPQARVGDVIVTGQDPGLTEMEFRKKGKLKAKSKVTRDTTSNALSNLRALYQKKDRLEGTITLRKSTYDAATDRLNYTFTANQGPEVKVAIEGVKVSNARLKLLIPIFEEGTIDNDLLNEGSHNIREFLQQQGYFDARVEYKVLGEGTNAERVIFTADRGLKHKVTDVTFAGNKYFSDDLLRERLRVQKADAYLQSGRYSQALVQADVSSIEGIYRANGFNQTKVAAAVSDVDDKNGKPLKVAGVTVKYTVTEGPQQKFGTVTLDGVAESRVQVVKDMLNTLTGQPFSLITLSGDRDVVQSYLLSQGFEQSKVTIKQEIDKADATKTDVTLAVVEGPHVLIDRVLKTGEAHVRESVVAPQIEVHAKDPLDQTALLDTQRNLYNLALFNQVNAVVQNPNGQLPEKNVLLQLTEAKRWDVTYGFGFEAQTGTPSRGQLSPASAILLGLNPDTQTTQQGKPGISPRVSADISRINLRGTQESLTLHATYGLLEEIAQLTFNNPNLFGNKNLNASVTGGYSNVQNITTFSASTLQGDLRLTQRIPKTDTLIYDFQYRRVSVDPNSLQVAADLIPLLSQPVRVGGPGLTWFHDRRSPSQLDATHGSYTTVTTFFASSKFGSQTNFNRFDGSFASYYSFGKRKYVFARNTRIGVEQSYGPNPNVGDQTSLTNPCLGSLLTTNASCSAVPLPERLYEGGATSHRGFPINGAGPRDLQTGFPVGGTAVFLNQSELRLPAPVLPVVGSSVSFVLFHDMGNVFQNPSQMFPSFLRYHQPDQDTCRDVSSIKVQLTHVGTCNFNYFSHAIGLGARYNTPVGPIRADLSYNLNPPIYPVIYDFSTTGGPHVGEAGHINFFFSIGQSF